MFTSKKLVAACCLLGIAGCGGGADAEDASASQVVPPLAVVPPATSPSVGNLSLSQQNADSSQSQFAEFIFSAEGAASFQCQLDNETPLPCHSPHTAFPLAVGEHTMLVHALDSSGSTAQTERIEWSTKSIFGDGAQVGAHGDLVKTNVQPSPVQDNSWKGILRINCDFAHSSYDDPIVYPGQDDAAHLHRFYGNLLLDEHSDLASLFTTGDSSCQGNTLNRSAYWVPALLAPAYDAVTAEPLLDAAGEPAWKVVPAVVGNDDEAHEIFYYSAGVSDLASIKPIPLGLKMIAGNHMAQPGMEQDTGIARWHCQSWASDESANPQWSTSIPECKAPDRVRMDLFFPSCWNGVDLDSADHKSHLAYPVSSAGQGMVCPASHPVPIVRVSFHYAFGVKPEVYEPVTLSSRGWRLASDMYELTFDTRGGMSLHGDWFNAWHPEALEVILATCIQQGLDCHDGNLGNGFRLSGTQPGTQVEPAIINQGLGG